MNAPLNIPEQILLSAWLDGEVSDAERAEVQALLQRPEARAYLQQLQAARVLVNRHGAVKAPVGLKGRVLAALDEDYDDISRPTASRNEGEGKVIALPTASWKTPLLALAAALLVAVGLLFGPSLLPRDGQTSPADIAREAARKSAGSGSEPTGTERPEAPKPGGTKVEDAPAEDPAHLARNERAAAKKLEGGLLEEKTDYARDAQDAKAAEALKDNTAAPSTGKPGDAEGADKGPQQRPGGNTWDGQARKGVAPPPASPSPANPAEDDPRLRAKEEKARTDALEDQAKELNEGKESPQAEDDREDGNAARPTEPAKAGATRRAGTESDTPGRQSGLGGGGGGAREGGTRGDGRANEGGDANADEENKTGQAERERRQDGDESFRKARAGLETTTVSLAVNAGRALAAQNDLLRVAALYGKATLVESDGGETIEVELDQARLADLVGALSRLAAGQDYGRVEAPEKFRDAVAGAGSETARDSLPADVKVQVSGATPEAAPAAPARMVRLVIELK